MTCSGGVERALSKIADAKQMNFGFILGRLGASKCEGVCDTDESEFRQVKRNCRNL